ncbi:hypothetical protein EJ05DRAFT_319687 [Pseudovirgaria hyperparasitica]|uniref:Cora-domain-containing protein n=1 Tax=Pseudovirgaria hyperparasitica TaxID=470096 RepID=A0A6A6WCX0_9PEZI|nr:uncharacterized protein EJ05DRAFT_319687 [Pseudovirgaria hyperparasitica]KAF2760029.1 hypothetical protein EJ05DRAFT_319687 [Pseudovirgaria hyperparasitica]
MGDNSDVRQAERGRILGSHDPIETLRNAQKEPKQRKYFDQNLQNQAYLTGDIFDSLTIKKYQNQWDITTNSHEDDHHYIKQVKKLSTRWPHLRLLADFMEIGTTPLQWPDLRMKVDSRIERWRRVKIARLDYLNDGVRPVRTDYVDTKSLHSGLRETDLASGMRLYVVEDLSRDVIEALGCKYRVEPEFFREHMLDYAWCNVRDRWAHPPKLTSVRKKQRWIQLRYVTPRYFENGEEFKLAKEQAGHFNVARRPDDDQNGEGHWDTRGTVVGLTRSRASFWLQPAVPGKAAIGIMLVDPSIKAGNPLWYGYRDWEETPLPEDIIAQSKDGTSVQDNTKSTAERNNRRQSSSNTSDSYFMPDRGAPQTPLFDDVVYWAERPAAFALPPSQTTITSDLSNNVPMQALMHLICSNWLTLAEYIRTRLIQIDWEIAFPDEFLPAKKAGVDPPLRKLHVWRRLVPLYRQMLEELFKRLADVTPHKRYIEALMDPNCTVPDARDAPDSYPTILQDFAEAHSTMCEHQTHIERLTSIVTATISIIDTRREQENNTNIARLTWLATFFIPLGYIASLFSIQPDVGALIESFRLYFSAALPISFLIMAIALITTQSAVRDFLRQTLGIEKKERTKISQTKQQITDGWATRSNPGDRMGWRLLKKSKKPAYRSSTEEAHKNTLPGAIHRNDIGTSQEV